MDESFGTLEIPVWVHGTQKWVTGLTKRTTCDDVVYALLYNDGIHDFVSTQEYAVFEKWREVERPLQGRTKIIKIWRNWGPEQINVQLSLKRIDELEYSGEFSLTRRRQKKLRHRPRERHHSYCQTTSERLKSMETLVKMILSQERTLKDLAERVSEADEMIEKLEARINFRKNKQNSHSCARHTALEWTSDAGLETILGNIEAENVEVYLEFCDKIIQLEENINDERAKFDELAKLIQECDKLESNKDNSEMGVCSENELGTLHVELNRVVTSYIMQQYKSQDIAKEIQFYEFKLRDKNQLLQQLQRELSDTTCTEETTPEDNCSFFSGQFGDKLYLFDPSAPVQNYMTISAGTSLPNQFVVYDDRDAFPQSVKTLKRPNDKIRPDHVAERKPILKQSKGQRSNQPQRGSFTSGEYKVRFKSDSLVDKYNWDESSFSEELSVDHQSDSDNRENIDIADQRNPYSSWNHSLPPAIPPKIYNVGGKGEENDSNSDTGLSSMHSDDSSTYHLETLV